MFSYWEVLSLQRELGSSEFQTLIVQVRLYESIAPIRQRAQSR